MGGRGTVEQPVDIDPRGSGTRAAQATPAASLDLFQNADALARRCYSNCAAVAKAYAGQVAMQAAHPAVGVAGVRHHLRMPVSEGRAQADHIHHTER